MPLEALIQLFLAEDLLVKRKTPRLCFAAANDLDFGSTMKLGVGGKIRRRPKNTPKWYANRTSDRPVSSGLCWPGTEIDEMFHAYCASWLLAGRSISVSATEMRAMSIYLTPPVTHIEIK